MNANAYFFSHHGIWEGDRAVLLPPPRIFRMLEMNDEFANFFNDNNEQPIIGESISTHYERLYYLYETRVPKTQTTYLFYIEGHPETCPFRPLDLLRDRAEQLGIYHDEEQKKSPLALISRNSLRRGNVPVVPHRRKLVP